MAVIGADPQSLDDLARRLRIAGDQLSSIGARIDAALGRTAWDGTDGERFRRRWRGTHRVALRDQAARCRSLAGALVRHADEQRRASLGTGAPTAATQLAPLPAGGRVLTGTVAGSIGPWSVSSAGTVRIDDLGRRRRVTYEEQLGAGMGVSGGTGLRATFGERDGAIGTTGEAGAEVGTTRRRTWTVDADDVPALLAAIAVDGSLQGAAGPVLALGGPVVRTLGSLTGTDLDVPTLVTPERTEDLLAIEVGASGWAALGGGATGGRSVDGAVAERLAVGTAREGDDSWLVLEAHGAVAADLGPSVGADGARSVRMEVPLHGRDGRPVVVTSTVDAGTGDTEVVRMAVDPTVAGDAVRTARRALQDLSRGDVDRARSALTGLRWPTGAVAVEATVLSTVPHDASLGGSVGAGSLSFEGSDERWTRRP